MLTLKERFTRLNQMIEKGDLLRSQWTDGKERACLLAALSPEAGERQSATACPANVLPAWFAELTPSMDDNGSSDEWPAFVKRYADVVRRAAETLDADGWRRTEYRVRALAVSEAMKHTTYEPTLAACSIVINLCQKVAEGGEISEEERSAAWSAARSAAWSAARSAAESAESAAESAASAAESAAWSAARSAAESAESAAESAAWSAAWSAASAAWDRMNSAILDALEVEISRVGASEEK